mmetsp:Transcript_7491/g.24948  ORF Transcript_7491/g.24948 Transcript_7491/m.24948 type:complete len:204 (-) Transcript_7491:609-1220(-)
MTAARCSSLRFADATERMRTDSTRPKAPKCFATALRDVSGGRLPTKTVLASRSGSSPARSAASAPASSLFFGAFCAARDAADGGAGAGAGAAALRARRSALLAAIGSDFTPSIAAAAAAVRAAAAASTAAGDLLRRRLRDGDAGFEVSPDVELSAKRFATASLGALELECRVARMDMGSSYEADPGVTPAQRGAHVAVRSGFR